MSYPDELIFLSEQVRLLTDRVSLVEALRDKVNKLEDKLENITPETNVTDSSELSEKELKPKQLIPLTILQDAFASYPELKDLLTSTPWCELDSKLLDGLVEAVVAGLRYNKFTVPPVSVITKRIKNYYSMRLH